MRKKLSSTPYLGYIHNLCIYALYTLLYQIHNVTINAVVSNHTLSELKTVVRNKDTPFCARLVVLNCDRPCLEDGFITPSIQVGNGSPAGDGASIVSKATGVDDSETAALAVVAVVHGVELVLVGELVVLLPESAGLAAVVTRAVATGVTTSACVASTGIAARGARGLIGRGAHEAGEGVLEELTERGHGAADDE